MNKVVSRRQYLTLIDIINLNRLQNLCFHEMTNTHLGHNWNTNSVLNFLNHLRITHT